MRILVLGAGGTGGYFGGRLAESGADVTFLVRPARAQNLKENGLVIESFKGNSSLTAKTVTADKINSVYDLILLSCKAYDLESSMAAITPAVGPTTLILPILNGLLHLESLDKKFGAGKILGGLVYIAATLKTTGEVVHLNKMDGFTFGARQASQKDTVARIDEVFKKANFDSTLSEDIMQEMWEKFAFLTSLAATTCLFRGSVGEILGTKHGHIMMIEIFNECSGVAAASNHALRSVAREKGLGILTDSGSSLTASMLRDLESGSKTEAEQIVGDLLSRGLNLNVPVSLLRVAYTHLQVYEQRQKTNT